MRNEKLLVSSRNPGESRDAAGARAAQLTLPHPSVADELPRAEGLGPSEAAERLGQGCVWDVAGEDGRRWRVFRTGQREQRVDMTAIEPYKKALSHGGEGGRRRRGSVVSA